MPFEETFSQSESRDAEEAVGLVVVDFWSVSSATARVRRISLR